MGRRKFRLSKPPKNCERQYTSNPVGRPKKGSSSSSDTSSSARESSVCESSASASSLSFDDTSSDAESVSSPVLGSDSITGCQTQLESLISGIHLANGSWITQVRGFDHAAVCKLSDQPCVSRQTLVVTFCIIVRNDMSWSLSVHGRQINIQQPVYGFLSGLPSVMNMESLQDLVLLLDECSVCPGNPDEQYILMVESMKGRLMSKDRKAVIATIDDFSSVTSNNEHFAKTVRVSTCEIVVTKGKCKSCVAYRNTLRSMYHRWSKQKCASPSSRQSTSSKVNLRWLNTPEKAHRYGELRTRLDTKSRQVKHLKDKIAKLMDKSGITLDSTIESDFSGIMSEMTAKVHQDCAEGSFKRIFWHQQLQASKTNNMKQMRWHPAIIKWCLHLKFLSSGSYHALRTAGLLTLPSERTLRDYTHWIRAGVGFLPEVDSQLVKEASITDEKDRYVVLIWDEMKVRESLIFNKNTCQLIGFTNLGEVNDQLDKLSRQCSSDSTPNPEVASHMLLFMVRGMFSILQFPYAHFATRGATADSLFPLVWEAVQHLEFCGFNVIAFCCDGASPNRAFYKMHGSRGEFVYKTPNPFCEGRDIYFICDVPHLIKTTRNCWSNSFAHSHSRPLWKDDQHISWEHLVRVFNRSQTASGLSLLPRLKKDHISLTSYSRMRVNLAAQVLSASVLHALEYFGEGETTKFIGNFDRFFDCLNVRSTSEGKTRRKPDLRPYRSPSDARLTWLKDGFLAYLQSWEDSVDNRKGFKKAEKQKMLLSTQTREGLKITVNAFVELATCLFSVTGVEYILSEKLCQDPLESFFGKQRAAGGRSDNPSVKQFCLNTVSLRVQRSAALEPIRGNCGKRQVSDENCDEDLSEPMPKRPRCSKL